MGIFCELRRMHGNPILAILAFAQLAEVVWDATGVRRFPFDYEQSKLIFIPAVAGVTRMEVDGTEVTKGGDDEIRSVYHEKYDDNTMLPLIAELAWHIFL